MEQFLQISVHTDMKSTKEAIFQQKPQNQTVRGQITFGIQVHTFPSECNTRNFNLKHETRLKKTHSNNGGTYTRQYKEVKEKL